MQMHRKVRVEPDRKQRTFEIFLSEVGNEEKIATTTMNTRHDAEGKSPYVAGNDQAGTSQVFHSALGAEERLRRIEEAIEQLLKSGGKRDGASSYRKNDRVVYIPKEERIERVLASFRKDPKEPIKVTILRLIEFAEKHLRRELSHEQPQNF